MIQNAVLVGASQLEPGATNALVEQGDVIGNPNFTALETNTYAVGCYLFQKDVSTGFASVTWQNTGTVATPVWTVVANNATAVAGAATLNSANGIVTSESLTTAAGSTYTLTITDSAITAASNIVAVATLGTSTTGTPLVTKITPTAGQLVIVVTNIAASAAFNGTLLIHFK